MTENPYVQGGLQVYATVHHSEAGFVLSIYDRSISATQPVYTIAGNLTAWAHFTELMGEPPSDLHCLALPVLTAADMWAWSQSGEMPLGAQIDSDFNHDN